jgi:hypothetical protein
MAFVLLLHVPACWKGTAERGGRRTAMRYLLAWLLGVPGIVIVIWFLVARAH